MGIQAKKREFIKICRFKTRDDVVDKRRCVAHRKVKMSLGILLAKRLDQALGVRNNGRFAANQGIVARGFLDTQGDYAARDNRAQNGIGNREYVFITEHIIQKEWNVIKMIGTTHIKKQHGFNIHSFGTRDSTEFRYNAISKNQMVFDFC